jgi:uncharacterized protein (UPF0335 family)
MKNDTDEQEPTTTKTRGIDMDAKVSFAEGQLKSLVERIERLEEEKRALSGDLKEVYAEAKGHGFDTKILRKVVAMRRKDAAEREEEDTMVTLYMSALGSIPAETR